jgi:hypothetical protein
MGPWVSQYRWYIRSELTGGGAAAFSVEVYDITVYDPSSPRRDVIGPVFYIGGAIAIPVDTDLRNQYENSKKR